MTRSRAREGRRFTGQYADDGKARRLAVRAEAGHRCIRCQHLFKSGEHGKGEWSPCDSQCVHNGPMRITSHDDCRDAPMVLEVARRNAGEIVKDPNTVLVEAQWRILTVHHLDGQKDNDAWWNTLALCQRCHLEIQGKVDPRVPWFLEHSEWFKPYVAGFYANHYFGLQLTREDVMLDLDFLSSIETKISHGTPTNILRDEYQTRLQIRGVRQ